MSSILSRVRLGAILLDARAPGWHLLDPEAVCCPDTCSCPLALAFPGLGYHGAARLLGLSHSACVRHGFAARASWLEAAVEEEFRQLTAAWRQEIELRRVPREASA